jgi:hypothetical protein
MRLLQRLLRGREISPDALQRNIQELSAMLKPRLVGKKSMIETIMDADTGGLQILPNRDVDALISRKKRGATGLVWTGTLLIFGEGGKPLRDKVECSHGMYDPDSVTFNVPVEYQGMEGGCLVAEHPHFRLTRTHGNGYVLDVPKNRLQRVGKFPAREGHFEFEHFFGLPVGQGAPEGKNTRFLQFRPWPFVGLAARSYNKTQEIYTSDPPVNKMAALVRPAITPHDYTSHVVEILRNGAERSIAAFAERWAKEDPALRDAMRKAGIQ